MADRRRERWHVFCDECAKLTATWLLFVSCLMAFRVFFIAHFSSQMKNTTSVEDVITTLITGFRFDSAMAGVCLFPGFIALVLFLPLRWEKAIAVARWCVSVLFLVPNLLACVITITYFQEYNEQFNHFVFLVLYDDKVAVLRTVIEQYHPVLNSVVYVGWLSLTLYGVRRVHNGTTAPESLKSVTHPLLRGVLVFLALPLIVCAVRGSADRLPVNRKWAAVSPDSFLNKTVITPMRSFHYALRDFRALQFEGGSNPYLKPEISAVPSEQQDGGQSGSSQLADYLGRKARGPAIARPQHIFLVVMESYDAWPLQDVYAPLGITKQVSLLGKKGLHFRNFLPASRSTMDSLATITSGVPNAGVNISLRGALGGPSLTSAFEAMEGLGYQTNFFYGGLLSWENLGPFMENQGVGDTYSAAHAQGRRSASIWGVDDYQLFEMVLDSIGEGASTFNVIMTTSYHSPFNLDVCAMGYPYETNEDYPESIRALDDGSIDANTLGHLWFSDKALGDFVKQAEESFPGSLFALTGDHYGRRYFHSHPTLYESSAVPFILYGEGILPGLMDQTIPGSHVDIVPTLIELFAPAGHAYNSFGEALQYRDQGGWGQAHRALVLRDEIWEIQQGRYLKHWTPQLSERVEWGEVAQRPSLGAMLELYNRQMGWAWEYTMNR